MSELEHNWIMKRVNRLDDYKSYYFIGLLREGTDSWGWSDASDATYKNWAVSPSQDRRAGKHQRGCASISPITGLKWIQTPCREKLKFICKRTISAQTRNDYNMRIKKEDPSVKELLRKNLKSLLLEMKQKNDETLIKLQNEKLVAQGNYEGAILVVFIVCLIGIIGILAGLYYLRKRTNEYENISAKPKPKKNQILRQAMDFKDYREDLNFLYN
jgi:hypothetical protein